MLPVMLYLNKIWSLGHGPRTPSSHIHVQADIFPALAVAPVPPLAPHPPLMMMFCLLVHDSVTSTPQWIRQPRPRVYLKEGTYHTRLSRGPSTNDLNK
jgi:hypothetical protein